ncbi:MAG: PD40 domain-containing protein [Candidatus Latescibacteria bacterium]|nr:PD40 domain-containing protein [Candidatus Latescibacterota bacterium]
MRTSRRLALLLALAALLGGALPARAQYLFGKNKVVYSPRQWLVSRSEKVELFFYPEEERLAGQALVFADSAAVELEGVFGLTLERPVPLVLYGSQHDFRETNVIPSLIPESVGGFTDLIRGRVVVPSTGDLHQLEHVIRHEMVHAVMLEKLARVMAERHQFSYQHPPLWFVEGLAEFYSVGPPDTEGEMLLREGIIEGSLPPLDQLWRIQGTYLMYKVGQSVLAYLDRNYSTAAVRGLLESWWRSADFERLLELELGLDLETLDRDWRNSLRRRYYPTVTRRLPAAERGRAVLRGGSFQVSPAALGDSSFVYLETATGRVALASARFPSSPRRKADFTVWLEGGRKASTESIPFMRSRPGSGAGLVALTVQRGPRDELRFLDAASGKSLASFGADSLVQLESPSVAADGRVLFSGITPSGRRDLFLLTGDPRAEDPGWRVRRLTRDDYDDRDPSWHPDGTRCLFSSDRGFPAASPHRNLYSLDLASGAIERLTQGPWVDRQPTWGPDGARYLYVSDRQGAWDVYLAEGEQHVRQTACFGAVQDPAWLGDGFLGAVYEEGRYRLYHFPLRAGQEPVAPRLASAGDGHAPAPPSPAALPAPVPYRLRWGLDFATSGLAYDPEFGNTSGGLLGFTDLLGNHQLGVAVTNTASTTADFFKRMSVGVSYTNLSRRWNWSVAAFHLSSDFDTNVWDYRYERRFGGLAAVSYPFNLFRRVEFSANVRGVVEEDELSYVLRDPQAVLGSLYASWIHDTVLWSYAGPLEGERVNVTVGWTTAFGEGGYGYTVGRVDARKYWRVLRDTVYAARVMAHYSAGDDPRYVHLGGPLQLRGWPHQHFHARGVLLTNQELRVPILRGIRLFMPLGALDLPSVRGSLFFDAARLSQRFFAIPEPEWAGDYGLGFELGLGPVLILRYNIARTTDFHEISARVDHELFLGWNF